MFCTNCGARNDDNNTNCTQCQSPLERPEQQATQAPPPPQYAQYGQHGQPYAQSQAQGPPPNPNAPVLEKPVTVGEWIVTFLLLMIPFVNIVLVFVWAFSNDEPMSKSNFFKAQLILFAIVFGAMIAIGIFMSVLFAVMW